MRNLFLLISLFYSLNIFAQTKQKVDSICYLLDTAKTPINDRMWAIHPDNGSIFGNDKSYVIQCPCLKDNGKPTFIYETGDNEKGLLINDKQLKALKLSSLSALIAKSKQIESNNYRQDYFIF